MYKKYVCILALCVAGGNFAPAQSLSRLVEQTQPVLYQEIAQHPALLPPTVAALAGQIPLDVSGRNTGAVAEYRAGQNQIIFFSKPLKKWLKIARQHYPTEQLPVRLARCIAPVYVHELMHARDGRRAAQEGFVWPVTLEDEYVASFWQLVWEQFYAQQDPAYETQCGPFLPAASVRAQTACQAGPAIYQRYIQAAQNYLPPPFTAPYIAQLVASGEVRFEGHIFKGTGRKLSANGLFVRGGNWLALTIDGAKQLPDYPLYRRWQSLQQQRQNEIDAFCYKP